jgi:hypothetical protein
MYVYVCIYMYAYIKAYVYLCERWVWACMWLHRLPCTRACDCARRRCGRRHRVPAFVRPPGYIANALVMYEYKYLSMQSPGMHMGTRVCSRIRVRSCSGADDARIRGMCASATRSLRKAIYRWNKHTHSVRIPNACMYLYPCAAGYTDERIDDAGLPHTRAHVLRPCACACASVPNLGTHTSVPTHASALRRLGPRSARLAGVPLGVGVQREHRRVEHRRGHLVVLCMRRRSGPGGAPPWVGRARQGVGAAQRRRRCALACVWAQTCGHVHARVCTCVGIAAHSKDGLHACMDTNVCICMYIYVCIYKGICVLM